MSTGSLYSDIAFFACLPGFYGDPIVLCMNLQWHLQGACDNVPTSLGCKCKQNWTLCEGWLGTNCRSWHGCAIRKSSAFEYCEVEASSCPPSASGGPFGPPEWDYCAEGDARRLDFDSVALPAKGPSRKEIFTASFIVVPLVGIGGTLLWRRQRLRDSARIAAQASCAVGGRSPPLGHVAGRP